MRRFSQEWFDALSRCRFAGQWPDWSGPRAAPVMPWITAPIHPYLRKAFDHMGEVRELNPGDWLYPHVQVRSYMLVEAGLTGRIVATADGQSGAGAMALSTPMRNAAGNLNWLTHRSAIGRYQALSHVRLREIPHSEALAFLMQADKDFYLALYAQMELINFLTGSALPFWRCCRPLTASRRSSLPGRFFTVRFLRGLADCGSGCPYRAVKTTLLKSSEPRA